MLKLLFYTLEIYFLVPECFPLWYSWFSHAFCRFLLASCATGYLVVHSLSFCASKRFSVLPRWAAVSWPARRRPWLLADCPQVSCPGQQQLGARGCTVTFLCFSCMGMPALLSLWTVSHRVVSLLPQLRVTLSWPLETGSACTQPSESLSHSTHPCFPLQPGYLVLVHVPCAMLMLSEETSCSILLEPVNLRPHPSRMVLISQVP